MVDRPDGVSEESPGSSEVRAPDVGELASTPVGTSHSRRFLPWREWPIAVVLCAIVVSVLLVVVTEFRIGAVAFACSVLLAAALRAALPVRRAGLLVVRGRLLDVLILVLLGGGSLALAILVPEAS